MKKRKKMVCPKCGGEMNHHADKLIHPATAEEAKKINLAFGGLVEETHACPACGAVGSRPAV
jgi:ribosomal protein S27AE